MIRRFLSVCALVAVMTMGGMVWADEAQDQIAQYRKMLDQQAEADVSGVASQDRQQAAKWLKEAEVLLANGDDEAAGRRLRRVEFSLDLIRAMVASAEIRMTAESQEASAFKAPKLLEQLQTEVDELRKKRAELQSELQKLQ